MASITLKDFMTQCQLYEHSQEHYELMKECSELVLLEQYIDNQLFMMENADILESADVTFEDGYFQESTSENSLDSIMESADEKKGNIFKRIWNGFKKLVERFANFLLRCATGKDSKDLRDKIDKLEEKAKENENLKAETAKKIVELQDQLGITVADLAEATTEKNKFKNAYQTKLNMLEKARSHAKQLREQLTDTQRLVDSKERRLEKTQEGYRNLNAKYKDSVAENNRFWDQVFETVVSHADKRAVLIKVDTKNNNVNGCADPADLEKLMKQYIDALTGNVNAIHGVKTNLKGAVQSAIRSGIKFQYDEAHLNEIANSLNSSLKAAGEIQAEKIDGKSGVASTAAETMAEFQKVVGATCALISKVIQYIKRRDNIITQAAA